MTEADCLPTKLLVLSFSLISPQNSSFEKYVQYKLNASKCAVSTDTHCNICTQGHVFVCVPFKEPQQGFNIPKSLILCHYFENWELMWRDQRKSDIKPIYSES